MKSTPAFIIVPFVDNIVVFQVLIKVQAAGVNPVETYIRSGVYAKLPTLPWTPGHDSAGTVEEVGSGVTKVKVMIIVMVS